MKRHLDTTKRTSEFRLALIVAGLTSGIFLGLALVVRWFLASRSLLVALALVALVGCSTTGKQAVQVVREGRALLRHPEPGDPVWEANRVTFLLDADLVAPVESAK